MSDSSGANSNDAIFPDPSSVDSNPAAPDHAKAEAVAQGNAEFAGANMENADEEVELVEIVERAQVTVRRTPRYFRLMAAGAIVAAIVVFIWTYSLPEQPNTPRNEVFGFMLLWGVIVGIGVGAVVALLLDLLARHWARTVPAEHITTVEREKPDQFE